MPSVAVAEGLGDGLGHLGLGLDHLGPALLDLGDHLLLLGHGHGPAAFGLGPGHAHVGLGLVGLQAGRRCSRPRRCRRCRSRRSRRRSASRAGGPARPWRCGRGSPAPRMCVSAEPMALTMPSPTRAMIVSSVAPPISCCRLARTVTRALTFSWMPFLATRVERFACRSRGPGSRSPWDRRWSARLPARCGRPGRWPWPA